MTRRLPIAWLLNVAVATLAVINLLGASAHAVVSAWNTDNSGNFNNSANWTNGIPGADDVAYFGRGNGITYTVTWPNSALNQPTSEQLLIGPNTVNFAPPSLPLVASTYTLNLNMLLGEPGSISILNTAIDNLAAPSAFVGAFTGSQSTLNVNSGTFTVSGSSQSSQELSLGHNSTGTMNIAAGAEVNVTGDEGNAIIGAIAGVTGTANVTGPGAAWNNMSNNEFAPLVIGGGGAGTLNITAGGHVNDHTSYIAREPGSTGTVSVDGPGSSWTNRGSLFVGYLGTGSLSISGGGVVNDNNATMGYSENFGGGMIVNGSGSATVTGAGSNWNQSGELRVGVFLGSSVPGGDLIGPGTLDIAAGGQVHTQGDAYITAAASSAIVTGPGSTWTVGNLLTIEAGATLEINGGGTVTSNNALAGVGSGGVVRVNGSGSTWNVPDTMTVGRIGEGQVEVTGGGRVTNRVAFVGGRSGFNLQSHGTVRVDGIDSNWTSSEQLFIGSEALGTMLISQGGRVTSGTGHLGLLTSGIGEVRVTGPGSQWVNTENLYIGVAGTGDLGVTNGGTVSSDGVASIGPRGLLQGNSTVLADVRNGGTVAPGIASSFVRSDAIGTLTLAGDYVQTSAGSIKIDLLSAMSGDKLAITGDAMLGGELKVTVFSGYTPALGDSFEILTAAGGITGTFAVEDLPPALVPAGGIGWDVVYTATTVRLVFTDLLPGDFNNDGAVDAADFVAWRKGGVVASTPENYNLWRTNFGETGSGGGSIANATVPEPAAALLLVLGAAIGFSRTMATFPARSKTHRV